MEGSVAVFGHPGALPPEAAALLAAGARRHFHLGRPWFEAVLDAAMPAGARAVFLLCRAGARAVLLVPLRLEERGGLGALTTLYSCLYQPLAAADATASELEVAGAALGRFCRGRGQVRLDAMDGDWPGLAALLAGVRRAGLVPLRFDHFGNWHEPVAGLSWDAYLAARPGALRETIRRRLRRAEGDPRVGVEIIDSPAGLEAGIAAYEAVYARSWKRPEPFPRFSAALMRVAAAEGALRLGLLRVEGRPVAAQYWVVADGVASVLKLAHDEAVRAMSPGTVLTAAMVRRLLDREGIAELDFGRGDDPYKALWAGRRRQRIGVVLADPRRPEGLAVLARHLLGRVRRLARGGNAGKAPENTLAA